MSLASLWTAKKSVWTQRTLAATQVSADMPSDTPHDSRVTEEKPSSNYRPVPLHALAHKLGVVEEEDRERRTDPLASMLVGDQRRWLAYEEEVREHGYPVVPDKYTTPYYKIEESGKPRVSVEQLSEWITGLKTTGNIAPHSTILGASREKDVFTRASRWIVGRIVEPSYGMQRSKNPLERLGGMFGEVVGGLALGALGAVEGYFKPYKAWESLETMYRHPMETAYYLNTPLGRASIVGSIGASAAIGWLGGKIVGGIARADLGDELYGLKPVRVTRRISRYSSDRYHYVRLHEDIVGELVPVKTPRKTVSGVVWKERVFPSGWHYRTIKTARASEPLVLTRIQPSREPVGPLASRIKVRAGGYRIHGPRSTPVESYVLMRYRVEETPVDLGLVRVIRRKPVIGRSTYAYRTIDYVELKPEGLFSYRIMFRGRKVLGHVMEKTVSEMGGTPIAIAPTRQGLRTGYWEKIEFTPELGGISLHGLPVRVKTRIYPVPPAILFPSLSPVGAERTISHTRAMPVRRVRPRAMETVGELGLSLGETRGETRTRRTTRERTMTRTRTTDIVVGTAMPGGKPLSLPPPRVVLGGEEPLGRKKKRRPRKRRKKRRHRVYAEYLFRGARLPQII